MALAGHLAVFFWPGHRSAPQGAHAGIRTGKPQLELAIIDNSPAKPVATTEAPAPAACNQEPGAAADAALDFIPPLPPMPKPEMAALPACNHEADASAESVASSLRGAASGLGRLPAAAVTLANTGDQHLQNSARGDDADGNLDLVDLTQLDCEPALLRVPEFHFPAHLSRQGLHAGRVTVVVRVNASGRVSLLSVTDSSHPDLIPAVCEAVAKALFQPPLRQGRRVALRYSWTLELKDRTQAPERRNS